METKKLNNGRTIPVLGIGTYRIQPEDAEKSVLHALQHGYRLIDTANIYFNEKAVGRAIQQSGVAREEIFLTSKIWPSDFAYERAVKAIDATLERLQVDYIDLLLLHQPVGKYMEAWRALEEAVEAGKVRSLGLSNFTGRDLDCILAEGTIKPVLNQIEVHPYCQQEALKETLAQHDIAVEAWYPLASANKNLFAEPILRLMAEKYGKSVVQIILRWHVQVGHIVIPGSKNPAHVDSNLAIFDFQLTDEEMEAIAGLDRGKAFLKMPKFVLRLFSLYRFNFDKQQ